jgi:hypothetical protein
VGAHIDKNGRFQSDKYPNCPAGKVPLSVDDSIAQDLLWEYAQRRREVDAEFSADLELCLRAAGYKPKVDEPPNVRGIVTAFNPDSLWGEVEYVSPNGYCRVRFHSTSHHGTVFPFRGERVEIVFNQARELLAVHEVA